VIADVQIGEFVTSFNMAGMSMTFVWFDEELERLWLAPATTPAFNGLRAPASTARSAAAGAERHGKNPAG
jgi:hypothetical protein